MLGEQATPRVVPSVLSARPHPHTDPPKKNDTGAIKTPLSKPTGILAVHIKKIKIINDEFMSNFDREVISVYVRVIVGGCVKCSCVHELSMVPSTLIFDDLKNFHLQLHTRRMDEENNLRVELIGFDRPDVHRVISRKAVHMFEIVKNMYMVETYRFTRMERVMAELEVEFCFAYGEFGYGYSNQLENRQTLQKEQVEHSMFCRLQPPPDRHRAEITLDVMTCLPVGQPAFINFTEKPELGSLNAEFGSSADLHNVRIVEEPMLLISRMHKRMHTLQQNYERQGSRKARIKFLTRMMRNDHLATDSSDEFAAPEYLKLKRRSTLPYTEKQGNITTGFSRKMALSDDAQGRTVQQDEEDESDLGIADIAKIMSAAPGVIQSKAVKERDMGRQIGSMALFSLTEPQAVRVQPAPEPELPGTSGSTDGDESTVEPHVVPEKPRQRATRWSIYKWLFPGKRMVDNRAPTTIASPAGGTTGLLADEKAGECEVNEIRRRAEHHPPTPGQTPAATTDETPGQTPAAAPSPGSRGSRRISWFGHRGSVQPQAAATTQGQSRMSWFRRTSVVVPEPASAAATGPAPGRRMSIVETTQNLMQAITGQHHSTVAQLDGPRIMVMPPTPCESEEEEEDTNILSGNECSSVFDIADDADDLKKA